LRFLLLFALAATCLVAVPGAALSQDQLIEGGGENELKPAEEGGDYTATFGLTNTTSAEIKPTATPVSGEIGCELSLDPAKLPANEFTEVTLKVPPACKLEKDGMAFIVDAEPALTKTLTLNASPKTDDPDWDEVAMGFKMGAILALFVVFLAHVCWAIVNRKETKWWRHYPWKVLDQLDDKWSFKDSWVANLTLAGALLATLLGNTEVIKNALGEDSDNAIALITLSAGIGAALLAVGQIWVLTWKRGGAGGWKKGGWVTVFGLYGGALFTLTGAFGEMWIVAHAAESFKLGDLNDLIAPFAWFAAALLAGYATWTLVLILEMGTNAPDPPAIADSRLLVAATLRGQAGVRKEDLAETIEEIETELKKGTPKQRREQQKQKREAAKENRPLPPEAKLPPGVRARPAAPAAPPRGGRSAVL
jgi:hypothetical protein